MHTGVTGRAAKMGHHLTIAMTTWRATVRWRDGEPEQVDLAVAVDSLEVLRGEGGVTPLSGPEKILARSNALRTLDADSYPEIRFRAGEVLKCRRLPPHRSVGDPGRIRERIIDLGSRTSVRHGTCRARPTCAISSSPSSPIPC